MSVITLGLATDFLTAGGAASSVALDSDSPMGYQQMERTRANFNDILNNLAYLRHAQVTLTNAQIKALPTTAITIVATPGTGHCLWPVSCFIDKDFSSGAYTNVNGTSWMALAHNTALLHDATVNIVNSDSSSPPELTDLSQFMTADRGLHQLSVGQTRTDPDGAWGSGLALIAASTSQKENTALVIYADNNGGGDFTGGNAANSMIVNVLYLVL